MWEKPLVSLISQKKKKNQKRWADHVIFVRIWNLIMRICHNAFPKPEQTNMLNKSLVYNFYCYIDFLKIYCMGLDRIWISVNH